jgi:hypothetical protein
MRMRKAGRKSLKVRVALGGVSMDEIISYFNARELLIVMFKGNLSSRKV